MEERGLGVNGVDKKRRGDGEKLLRTESLTTVTRGLMMLSGAFASLEGEPLAQLPPLRSSTRTLEPPAAEFITKKCVGKRDKTRNEQREEGRAAVCEEDVDEKLEQAVWRSMMRKGMGETKGATEKE